MARCWLATWFTNLLVNTPWGPLTISYTPLTTLGSLPWSSLNLYLPRASKLNGYTSSVSLRLIRIWEIRVLSLSLKRSFNKTASQTDTVVGFKGVHCGCLEPLGHKRLDCKGYWDEVTLFIPYLHLLQLYDLYPRDFIFDFIQFSIYHPL